MNVALNICLNIARHKEFDARKTHIKPFAQIPIGQRAFENVNAVHQPVALRQEVVNAVVLFAAEQNGRQDVAHGVRGSASDAAGDVRNTIMDDVVVTESGFVVRRDPRGFKTAPLVDTDVDDDGT